jgi:inosose dehydratase
VTLRRDFLKAGVILATGPRMIARSALNVHLGCQTNAWPVDARDFSSVLGVIRKLKAWGYEGFETGFANVQGQFEHAAEAKAKIAALGTRFFGVHIFLQEYDTSTRIAPADLYERIALGGARLGAERLILSGAPAGIQDGLKQKAGALNRAGEFAAKARLKLAYHNHGPEFENGGAEIDFLLRETDPAKVSFLLDAGHAFRAGADLPGFIRKHFQRLAGLHLRDFKDGEQVPLGAGDFPLQAVVDAIRETGWSGWVLNEEERVSSKPGDAAAKPAHDALFRAFGKQA